MRNKGLQLEKSEVIRLTSDEINHKKLRSRKLHNYTILHYSPFKAVWDWFVLLLVVYTAIFTPYAAAFLLNDDERRAKLNKEAETRAGEGLSSSYTEPLVILDLIVDIMFIVDIFINFRTTFIDDVKGEVVSDPAKIAKHYLKGWFVIDVLAAIPFDLILFGLANDEKTTTTMGLLKSARLLRLLRVARRLDQYSQYAPAVIFLLMCAFTLVAHWMACCWYSIGEGERDLDYGWLNQLSRDINETYREDDTGGPSAQSKYVTSLYFTLTILTTVGFGNVAPTTDVEKLFAICMMLVGSLMFACIFGNMTAIIERLYEGMARYHQQLTLVKEFVKFHNVPHPLRRRLQEYFKHAWVYSNGNDLQEVDEVMKDFPDFLQADISLHLNRNLLNGSPAFKGVEHGCLRALSVKFQNTHTAPGDILLHRGDSLNQMYFISRGSLEILRGNVVLAILGKNDVVGENFCQRPLVGRSKGTVRALTYCDLLTLYREDLMDVIKMYPDFREHFAEKVEVTIDMRDTELDKIVPDIAPKMNHWPSTKTVLNRRFSAVVAAAQAARKSKEQQQQRSGQGGGAGGGGSGGRVELTPCPSTETVASKAGSEASCRDSAFTFQSGKWKRKPSKINTVVSIETKDDEDKDESDPEVPLMQRKYRHYTEPHQRGSKTAEQKHSLVRDAHRSVEKAVALSSLGNREAPEGAVTASLPSVSPRAGAADPDNNNVGYFVDNNAIHSRIDGLYTQLGAIERKFDEQKAAIIECLIGKSRPGGREGRPAAYLGTHPVGNTRSMDRRPDDVSGPTRDAAGGDPNSGPTLDKQKQDPSYSNHSDHPLIELGVATTPVANALGGAPPEGTARTASDRPKPVVVTSSSLPPQQDSRPPEASEKLPQLRTKNFRQRGAGPGRSRGNGRPFSVPGRVSMGSRSPNARAPSLTFPVLKGEDESGEVIWLERRGEELSGSRISSTSC
ncbi:potassium voltage-gated channel unc-103-like [Acanthaster planci]|uniref:Potassium voltage-gated channel unc-103-like n=1 Tax=Acanthaster planci TaxID=133434 RepID=A0A8B7Z7D0_ACAPL|nr:potassium voltage-gated channel unc-103-like [Acanthaster planci]XP_022099210.1 potassium voltage-gated channel unc-103-like [Acanthaster planci]XP_022099211.1 potassium voltage-gated channel unc-103-like [Acanthaster planci]XP_022099212.1 potassium voltage-gated channel unc-103-like [Acanthaster planci]XP_022099214.1 potassium voltage-gated channel unc-103-like [Acanthaster planci]